MARCRAGSSSLITDRSGGSSAEAQIGVLVAGPEHHHHRRTIQPTTSTMPSSKPESASPSPRCGVARIAPSASTRQHDGDQSGDQAEEGNSRERADQGGDRQPVDTGAGAGGR